MKPLLSDTEKKAALLRLIKDITTDSLDLHHIDDRDTIATHVCTTSSKANCKKKRELHC